MQAAIISANRFASILMALILASLSFFRAFSGANSMRYPTHASLPASRHAF